MSWKRCSGFLIVTPMYCWASGQGLQQCRGREGGDSGNATVRVQAGELLIGRNFCH